MQQLSDEQLKGLLRNAIRIAAESGHPRQKEAADALDAISREFGLRRSAGDYFRWPSTDPPDGRHRLISVGWRDEGMLSYLDYHVGQTNPTPEFERRAILAYMFEKELPPLGDAQYVSEWGTPFTPPRLRKLANTIAALTRNAKARDPIAFAKAIREWETDLEFLREKYYVGFFNWPPT